MYVYVCVNLYEHIYIHTYIHDASQLSRPPRPEFSGRDKSRSRNWHMGGVSAVQNACWTRDQSLVLLRVSAGALTLPRVTNFGLSWLSEVLMIFSQRAKCRVHESTPTHTHHTRALYAQPYEALTTGNAVRADARGACAETPLASKSHQMQGAVRNDLGQCLTQTKKVSWSSRHSRVWLRCAFIITSAR